MAYIQGFGQQWQTGDNGQLQSYNANTPTIGGEMRAGVPTQPQNYSGADMFSSGINYQGGGDMAPRWSGPTGYGGGSPSPSSGGSAGMAGAEMGGQVSAGPQFTGFVNPMAQATGGGAPVQGGQSGGWNSGIPGLGANPFQGQAGGQDMLGNYTLNNRNFTSLEDANALAKALGANVVSTNYEDGSRTPEYNLDFGRGSPLNAGQLAYYFGPNSSFAGIRNEADRIAAIKRSIEDELRYNDSGMERQVADKRDQFSSFKNTPGGYSSGVKTGSGAPSLSDTSFWQNTQPLPWQAAAGPASQPGFANGLPGAPGTVGDEESRPGPGQMPPPQGGGQVPGRTQNPFSMFNMSPNMNSLYYLNQRPNQQLGGLGMMGQNGQFSPLGAAGFGGFGNQMPFTMGGMPGFMGQQMGQNPLAQSGGGLMQLLQMLAGMGLGGAR